MGEADQIVDTGAAVAHAAVQQGKAFYKSKTFWANVVGAGAAYAGYIPPAYTPYVFAGVNILLRFLTNKPVTLGSVVSILD